ncbi:MAG: hypothetical protein WDM89_22385 [Rhizomicrobium sp.]
MGSPQKLPSVARLTELRSLQADELKAAEDLVARIVSEGRRLEGLAKDPSAAGRARLYARIAAWIEEHPDPNRSDDLCVACGGSLEKALDPVSGMPVKQHLHDARADAELISQTIRRWAENAQGYLANELPDALQRELRTDLPGHPCDLLRTAIVDELFGLDPFRGVLLGLKTETAAAFDATVTGRADLGIAVAIEISPDCKDLSKHSPAWSVPFGSRDGDKLMMRSPGRSCWMCSVARRRRANRPNAAR